MTSENISQAMASWIMDKGFGVISFLMIVTYVPQISLWLPKLMYGN